MEQIQQELDAMIDLITQVEDEALMKDLAVTLQRLHMANQAYITMMYEALTQEEVAVTH